jgi:subtilisin family serine protease
MHRWIAVVAVLALVAAVARCGGPGGGSPESPAPLHALLESTNGDSAADARPLGLLRGPTSSAGDPLVDTTDPTTTLPYQWQLAAAHADRALQRTQGDAGMVVGIIDTGADDVPDLAGKIDALWTVEPDGTLTSQPVHDGNDDTGHGTAVASLIAANVGDGFGMAGFGGAAHVVVVRAGTQGVFHDTAVAIALKKLDSLGVRIVNMSLGGPYPSQPVLLDAIHKAAADGMLIVAAAGNEADDVDWPAAALQPSRGGRGYGLAVGASDVDGVSASFSNSGRRLSLVAPGSREGSCTGVLVALPPPTSFENNSCYPEWAGDGGSYYGYLAGTSFAAPEVAGVAALIWSMRPELANWQVADIIKQSARRDPGAGWTPTAGCGVLDAERALELASARSTAAGARAGGPVAACSTQGDAPPGWPTELRQTIAFALLPDRTLGERDFEVGAAASSGLRVSFRAAGSCTVRRAMVHLTGAGVCVITASQPGNASYEPARTVSRSFSIVRHKLRGRGR